MTVPPKVSQTPGAPALCRLADLPDPGGRGFALAGGRAVFVIRRGGAVFGYVNSCPHVGTPLDWSPDRFLSPDLTEIQCSTHGARFRIEDGLCVFGPCLGRRLEPVSLCVVDGVVRLGEDR